MGIPDTNLYGGYGSVTGHTKHLAMLTIMLGKAMAQLSSDKRESIRADDDEIRKLVYSHDDLPVKIVSTVQPTWNSVIHKAVLTKPPADEPPRQRRHIDLT